MPQPCRCPWALVMLLSFCDATQPLSAHKLSFSHYFSFYVWITVCFLLKLSWCCASALVLFLSPYQLQNFPQKFATSIDPWLVPELCMKLPPLSAGWDAAPFHPLGWLDLLSPKPTQYNKIQKLLINLIQSQIQVNVLSMKSLSHLQSIWDKKVNYSSWHL